MHELTVTRYIDAPPEKVWEIEPEGKGTRCTGRARHWREEDRKKHEEMGFHEGWKPVADQLAELCEGD